MSTDFIRLASTPPGAPVPSYPPSKRGCKPKQSKLVHIRYPSIDSENFIVTMTGLPNKQHLGELNHQNAFYRDDSIDDPSFQTPQLVGLGQWYFVQRHATSSHS